MSSPEAFPAVADVERFGNLLLSAWAPPSHMLLADAWIESVTGVLLGSSEGLFLLGHRPSRVASLSREALAEETRLLLGSLSEEPGCSSLHRIPQEVARASTALLRSGNLHVRQRRVDESTGQAHVDSTHVGRVLVLLSVDATVGAVETVAVSAPLQVHLACMTNPDAGLRQPEARWLRSVRSWTDDTVVTSWSATSLTFLAGSEALLELRSRLLSWLPEPASDA